MYVCIENTDMYVMYRCVGDMYVVTNTFNISLALLITHWEWSTWMGMNNFTFICYEMCSKELLLHTIGVHICTYTHTCIYIHVCMYSNLFLLPVVSPHNISSSSSTSYHTYAQGHKGTRASPQFGNVLPDLLLSVPFNEFMTRPCIGTRLYEIAEALSVAASHLLLLVHQLYIYIRTWLLTKLITII